MHFGMSLFSVLGDNGDHGEQWHGATLDVRPGCLLEPWPHQGKKVSIVYDFIED